MATIKPITLDVMNVEAAKDLSRNFGRLLAANQLGVYVLFAYNYRWITYGRGIYGSMPFDEYYKLSTGKEAPLRTEGSLITVLDKVDEMLTELSMSTFHEQFKKDNAWLEERDSSEHSSIV